MADGELPRRVSGATRLSPEEVAKRGFATAFRGISETEVRNFLRRVADDVAYARDRERELVDRVEQLERQLRTPPPVTEQQLLESLGEETARVLRSAQQAAEDIRAKAQERSTLLVDQAQAEARRLQDEAEQHNAERLRSAEEAAAELLRVAEASGAESRAQAEAHADDERARATREAEAEIEGARTTGREMVNEARVVRERVLTDLAKRRAILQTQIEELEQGRDRLLAAYNIVKQTLTDATDALVPLDTGASGIVSMPREVTDRTAVEPSLAGEPAVDLAPPDTTAPAPDAAAAPEPAPETAAEPAPAPEAAVAAAPAAAPETGAPHVGIRRYMKSAFGLGQHAEEPGGAAPGAPQAAPSEPQRKPPKTSAKSKRSRPSSEETAAAAQPRDVDALFAKIRAARTEAVEEARDVLATEAEPEPGESAAIAETPVPGSDAALLQARDAALAPIERDLLRVAKRALQDEQNELLDVLRTIKGRPTVDKVLPALDAQVDTWSGSLRPAVEAAYGAGVAAVEPGTDIPTSTDLVHELADRFIVPLRDRVAATFGDDLRPAGAEGDEADLDDTDLAQRIGARYREWKSQQLEGAVGDVVVAAYARGVHDAAADGIVLRWITAEGGCCPDCDDNTLEPTDRGKAFPTGQHYPPAHPGCRCVIAVAGNDAAPSTAHLRALSS